MLRKIALAIIFGVILSVPAIAKDTSACTSLLRVLDAASSDIAKDSSVEICLKNVPVEYVSHPHFLEWARDPDQSNAAGLGRISKQSIREAMAAVELERSGQVVGPIVRGERSKHADFVDGLGDGFDIKAFSSRRDVNGSDLDPGEVVKEVLKKLNRSFRNIKTNEPSSIRVYMDLTWLNSVDRQRVKFALELALPPELLERVSFFELPEPQERFRARIFEDD